MTTCPLCAEDCSGGGVMWHLNREHGFDFASKEEMIRRMSALGFTLEPVQTPNQDPSKSFLDKEKHPHKPSP